MSMSNTCKALIDRVNEIWPAQTYFIPSRKANWRPKWRWQITSSREVLELLEELEPELIAKRDRVEVARAFVSRTEPLDTLKTSMVRLNKGVL